ncbi:nuclear transport factor 2 family protein [Archangium lansingense]|uniref:nuclear transport factor 2 family protein n=1 Tax=Archangium lansingense TaxID=2995310 RepID=UPI003B8241ED
MSTTNLDIARRYLRAIEQGATGEALAAFFHPEVTQQEYPNRLVPTGATRDLRALLEGAERGQKAVGSQRYEVRHTVAEGDHVALEVDWSATLKVPVGKLPAGGTMRATLAMFITFRDGLIVSQHNYDCFEPF